MKKKQNRRFRFFGAAACLLAALFFTLLLWQQPWKQADPGTLEVHMLDVGQGDCILLRSGGQTMLIDTGPRESGEAVADYLCKAGIKKLDSIVITHDHSDHTGGLPAVLAAVDTRLLVLYDQGDRESGLQLAGELAGTSACDVDFVSAGRTLTVGDAILTVMYPQARMQFDDPNDGSLVLLAESGDTRMLFTGDSTRRAEKAYADLLPRVDLLKVAHHGSDGSTGDELLAATCPDTALISVGAGNAYGHPGAAVLERLQAAGAVVYRTDLSGTLVVRASEDGLTVTPAS